MGSQEQSSSSHTLEAQGCPHQQLLNDYEILPTFSKQASGCLHWEFRVLHTKCVPEGRGGISINPLTHQKPYHKGCGDARGGPACVPRPGSFLPEFNKHTGHIIFFQLYFITAFSQSDFQITLGQDFTIRLPTILTVTAQAAWTAQKECSRWANSNTAGFGAPVRGPKRGVLWSYPAFF